MFCDMTKNANVWEYQKRPSFPEEKSTHEILQHKQNGS